MAKISKFGQYVLLKVHEMDGKVHGKTLFETDSLKIDFDIRSIKGWERAKITLTNLSPKIINKISYAQDAYVTVYTSLHGSPKVAVINSLYISNSLEEINVPESIFTMYCYSKLRKLYLEKNIDVITRQPNLKKIIKQCLTAAKFDGISEFKHFPDDIISHASYRRVSREQGTLGSVLERLGEEYGFNIYTESSTFVFVYKANFANVKNTDFYNAAGTVKLSTDNMRSNPKLGKGQISVVSNLDTNIKPSAILDITNLLTIGVDSHQSVLEQAKDFIAEKIGGNSLYLVSQVQHKGSNWDSTWMTQTVAYPPTQGITMAVGGKWWTQRQ